MIRFMLILAACLAYNFANAARKSNVVFILAL